MVRYCHMATAPPDTVLHHSSTIIHPHHNNLENTAMANGASDCGEEARRRSLRRRLALTHRQIKA